MRGTILAVLVLLLSGVAFGQATVISDTDFSTDFENWTINPATPATRTNELAGQWALKCSQSTTGDCGKWLALGSGCSGVAVSGVGAKCNPAADPGYLAYRRKIYIDATSLQNCAAALVGNSQAKLFLARSYNVGTEAWLMSGCGFNFNGGFAYPTAGWDHWGDQVDNGTAGTWTIDGRSGKGGAIPTGQWVREVYILHRDTTAHTGEAWHWFNSTTSTVCDAGHGCVSNVTSSGLGWDTNDQQVLRTEYFLGSAVGGTVTFYTTNVKVCYAATFQAALDCVNSDITAPGTVTATVTTIASPASGTVTLAGTCSTTAVGKVCNSAQFKLFQSDGTTLIGNLGGSQAGTGPYSVSWDTNTLSKAGFSDSLDGNYTVGCTMTDDGGNSGDCGNFAITIHNAIIPRPAVRH